MKKISLLKWFTLVEILVWILIFSIVIIWWFKALVAINIWKIKLIEETNIEKEALYFSEKLFEEIKKGWLVDYEEYFNRKIVNIWKSSLYSSWHYLHKTGFWNFGGFWSVESSSYWNNFYYCVSWSWVSNSLSLSWVLSEINLWCVKGNNDSDWNSGLLYSINYSWKPQRYGQYSFQFKDYNINYDNDSWDEDWDDKIIWDDDDGDIWLWVDVFSWWLDVKELYLISWDKNKRTFFRWNVIYDKSHPTYDSETRTNSACDFSDAYSPTWTWCLWTIEFLKLDWYDFWMDHSTWDIDENSTQYDWVIDTWLINKDFAWWEEVIAWSNTNSYWVPLFPDSISVSDFKVFVYPNKDLNRAWKENQTNIAPYVRINITLIPGFRNRKWIKWSIPEINISTTISLSDIFSR